MTISLSDKVAIVTGAGSGLGRSHAMALARRGARIVVNDSDARKASEVAGEICSAGKEAIAYDADVTDFTAVEDMVKVAYSHWGDIDILVNNAGILRDRTFAKMDLEDFRKVLDVNLMGSVHCCKAVWNGMRERGYGRIVLTTSSSGLYGQFGQANYSAAKMALVGLMKTLSLEGRKYGIHANCLAPSARTAMTHPLYSAEALVELDPALVSPAVVALASNDAPSGEIVLAGAGSFEVAYVTMTRGLHLGSGDEIAETLLTRWDEIAASSDCLIPETGDAQYRFEVTGRAIDRAIVDTAVPAPSDA